MNESPSTERKAWEAPELTDLSVRDDTLGHKPYYMYEETTLRGPS